MRLIVENRLDLVTFDYHAFCRPSKFMRNSLYKSEIGLVVFELLSAECVQVGRKLVENQEKN